jgi:hypothetical protein
VSAQSADSVVAAVREAAVQPLAALVTAVAEHGGGDIGDGAWARHALLRLLDDDAPGPAAAVLGCGGALTALLPADQLACTLLQRMHTAARLAVRTASAPATMAHRRQTPRVLRKALG